MADFRAEVRRRLEGLELEPHRQAEVEEELAQHLADSYETALGRGMDPESALAAALAELSDSHLLALGLRESVPPAPQPTPALGMPRGPRLFASLWLDLRHALRALRKSPGYTAVAVLTLALGIGASTAIFSVVNAVVLSRLPYPESENLVRIFESNLERGWSQFSFSQPNFIDFAARTREFERLAAISPRRVAFDNAGQAELLAARAVSHGFLSTLRVAPVLGRDFNEVDDTPGGDNRVALLMGGFWRSAFGADPNVLGRSIQLDGASYEVIGVMPDSFRWGDEVRVLLPLAPDRSAARGDHRLSVIGRLAPGASIESARRELETIARGLGREYPETNQGWGVTLLGFFDWFVPPESRQSLLILAGAVALLLLIACGNVANLMLARALVRRRELAIRTAIGADRGRIVGYVLVEALLLAFGAGVLGVALAVLGLKPLVAFGPDAFPRLDEVTVGPVVLAFGLALALATGLAFGSLAAWRAARVNVNATLRDSSQGSGTESRRLRSMLVLGEVALSVALLIGAGLLIRSYGKLQSVDPGFDPAGLSVASINLPRQPYGEAATTVRYFERLLAELRALPGVRGAALASMVPFSGGDTSTELKVPGWDREETKPPSASWRLVSPGYFAALGIPLRGRDFTPADVGDGAPVTIISERMAQLYWPGQDPIGKSVIINSLGPTPCTVIGVAGDVRNLGLEAEPGAVLYFSALAAPGWNPMQLVVKSGLPPDAQLAALRQVLAGIDANVPMFGFESMERLLARTQAERRFSMYLLVCFAISALVLACVGLGGVIGFLVSQRTREIGVRMALGASSRQVFRLVVGDGLQLAFAGAGLGVLAALLLAQGMSSLLYGVSARDPLTFALVPGLMLAVALLSCWWPARRAALVDPNRVLRSE